MSPVQMPKEVYDALEKALPKLQIEMLQARLKQADRFDEVMKELESSIKKNQNLHDAIAERDTKIYLLEHKIKEDKDLFATNISRAQQLEQMQDKLQLALLQKDVECAQKVAGAIEGLAHAAFRNPSVQKTFTMPVVVPGGGSQNGGYMNPAMVQQHTSSETSTTT